MLDYTTTEKIRRLNDCFRRSMAFGGSVMLTTGVACLDSKRKVELLELVRTFDSFTPDNDPHREHDFGAIDLGVCQYFWKIDYYDLSRTEASPDPADLAVTHRVLTIIRADEY
jgi:hypothetical protein